MSKKHILFGIVVVPAIGGLFYILSQSSILRPQSSPEQQKQPGASIPKIIYELCVHESSSRNLYSPKEYTANDGKTVLFSGSSATANRCDGEQGNIIWRVLEGSILEAAFYYFDAEGKFLNKCGTLPWPLDDVDASSCNRLIDLTCNKEIDYCAEL